MKDISIYFKPVSAELQLPDAEVNDILVNDESGFPTIDKKGVAIIYVPEYRNGKNQYDTTNEEFRSAFYQLHRGDNWDFQLYDLGTIMPGESVDDTYFAVAQVIAELVKKDVIPFIIGGSQDLVVSCYKGFEGLERTINICAIDSALDVGEPNDTVRSDGYVSHLLMQRPCYLFNYATIGVQRPLVSQTEMDLFEKLYFDVCRLGAFNADFKVSEPYLRNSDLLTVDFSSIKSGEIDLNNYPNVNGFLAEQMCQIMKYGGMSDKMSCVSVLDVNPKHGPAASSLLAQLIWYFADGVAQRCGDFPIGSKLNYTKFHVHLDDFSDDLVFYKSDKSGRWWLEVSYPAGQGGKYERHHLVPCDHQDYENALKNRIPDLWWRTLQKLS